jgi:hypothetical protein
MSERIKQLAIEAGLNATHSSDHEGLADFDYRKFADLIIDECAALFPLTFTDEQYQRRIDKTIKKHFEID